jgi:phosphoenolpyruvate-protein kinase (PTS system EI component)
MNRHTVLLMRIKRIRPYACPVTVGILLSCIFAQTAFSFTSLRPPAVAATTSGRVAYVLNGKPSAAGMAVYHGACAPLPGTVIASAALVSKYSAYDMMRHIDSPGDIAEEINTALPMLIKGIKGAFARRDRKTRRAVESALETYRLRIKQYLACRQDAGDAQARIIRNSIGTAKLLLGMDLRIARMEKDPAKEALLIEILEQVDRQAVEDINAAEGVVVEKDAQLQWRRFSGIRDKMISDRKKQAQACNINIRELDEKIRALVMRNTRLDQKLVEAQSRDDTDETEAILALINSNTELIGQCESAKQDLNTEKEMRETHITILKDINDNIIKSPEHILQRQKTVSQIIYNDAYKTLESLALYETGSQSRVFAFTLSSVESIIARLIGISPLYLKADARGADLVLISDKELPAEELVDLLHSEEYPVKAIVCFEGSMTSHWVVLAQGMGVPVALLNSSMISAEELAAAGDDIIIETTQQGRATVISNPDKITKNKYGFSALEQQFYYNLCQQQYARRKSSRLRIYANVADKDTVEKGVSIGVEGVGLYRTEFAPSDNTKNTLRDFIRSQSSENRTRLLEGFSEDLYTVLSANKTAEGPFIMRTDDFEADKNTADTMRLLGKSGFDLYRTDIGKAILTLRIAGYYIALKRLQDEGGYAFSPGMIFPMVKQQGDMHFIREEIMPEARKTVNEYIGIESYDARESTPISTGPMIETVEAYDNCDSIKVDPETDIISVGNSDFTASVLSREFGIAIDRNDRHFAKAFSSLKPEVCRKYYDITDAVSDWNTTHPENPKTMGFCGAQAGQVDFILFASFLQKEFKNVSMHVSVSPGMAPLIYFFMQHITDEDLAIFRQGIGFKTHQLASEKVSGIYARIRQGRLYKEQVTDRLKSVCAFVIDGTGVQDMPAAPRLHKIQRQKNNYGSVDSAG